MGVGSQGLSIVRLGTVGNFHHQVLTEREDEPVVFVEEEKAAAQEACDKLSFRQRVNLFGRSATANAAQERLARAIEEEERITKELAVFS